MNENAKICSVPGLKYFLIIRSNIIVLLYHSIIISQNNLMWIENELKKDAEHIQESINALSSNYHSKLAQRSIRTRMRENKENTTRFFTHFYELLRKAEYDIYKQFAVLNEGTRNGGEELSYEMSEVRNSANDLPHPRLLSELYQEYERNVPGRYRGNAVRSNDDDDDDDDDAAKHRYIPYKIYCYIREKSEYCIRFQHTVRGRLFTLYFITFPESHVSLCNKLSAASFLCKSEIAVYQLYAYKVFIWLSMVSQMSDVECSEKLDIYFYMTPFKKTIPSVSVDGDRDAAILSAIHVNTGLTRNCERHGEVVVYRAEEWFKVFIHESIHNFNIDFIDSDLRDANERLRRSFCIPHGDVLLFEAYTEAWARIINTMIETYFSGNEINCANFIRVVREKLTKNSFFHLYQLVKSLDVMDLKYSQITVLTRENMSVCRKRYAEDTNVYAYYIFGGILSAFALPFICWCCDHNTSSVIRFKQTNKNLSEFTDLICDASRDPMLVSMIEYIEASSSLSKTSRVIHPILKKTMRMTLD